MRSNTLAATAAFSLLLAVPAGAHDAEEGTGTTRQGRLRELVRREGAGGTARAVAMLHSFWYSAGEKAFRDVLEEDPSCAIATWGIASILMNNPLAGQGASPKGAEAAQAAIEQGRRIGAKTQRERDYIEAVAAYYADFANRPERARQAAARAGLRGAGGQVPATTTRRRSSTRSTSPARSRRPTRPMRPT